jgi:hypothetical protein
MGPGTLTAVVALQDRMATAGDRLVNSLLAELLAA